VSLERDLREVIARLEMVSHVSAVSLESSGRDTSDDIGGKRPPGGLDHAGDREADWLLKSADHYRRRAARAHTERALQAILQEALASLHAWQHQTPSVNPVWGSFEWKRQIALEWESKQRSTESVKIHYSIGERTLRRYVAAYGTRSH
jgi:hypothetical protein